MTFAFTSPPAAQAPGASGFSFGSPSASGPAPAFGTPAQAPVFGTPAAAPATGFGGFGPTSAAAPAQATGFGGFGTPAAAVPSPATGFSGFGAPAAAPAPATGFEGFGSSHVAAPAQGGFGGFGAAPATATAFGQPSAPSAFGRPAAPQSSMFGVPTSVSSQTPQQQHDSRERQLAALKLETILQRTTSSYNPGDAKCRFQHLFYNKVDPAQRHLYTRPNHVAAASWEEAEGRNPDPENYVPAPVVGVENLGKRVVQQQLEVKKLKEYLDSLRQASKALGGKVRRSEEMVMDASRQQEILSARLLQAMRKVEVLRCLSLPIQPGELEFRSKVNQLHASLDKPQGMLGEINREAAAYKLVRSGGGEMQKKLIGEGDLKALFKVLAEQQNGINHLANLVKKDKEMVDVIRTVDEEEKMARFHNN